ncbi:FAD-dependent oxidoreductase [Marinobacterium aestuarii]|uniref:FAD-dependent oxidoreductase n=1 Tax=Marinobacterium aestuarii TaxID=1821621 RepID=A0A1A9EY32_9GAMM|nr:FAD-dependent oxidoreductase [Marinobacterium aestuarii]ANG62805.1 FAD-dependent oxidoreductase [Marinobacterium aestuarii]
MAATEKLHRADPHIVVLGAGPAGGAVALGLRRLGYRVTVVAEPRPFAALEGVSERVLAGLKQAGFAQALAAMPAPSPRQVTWNGETSGANTERLIRRVELDLAIGVELVAQGVKLIAGRVRSSRAQSLSQVQDGGCEGYSVEVQAGGDPPFMLEADFLVEARGRAAPGAGLERLRGPETVSLLQAWQGPAMAPRSAVQSFDAGWAWMAATADGQRYLQLTLDVASAALPPKEQLTEFCVKRLASLSQAQPFMQDAAPIGQPQARTSTPILCLEPVGNNWIRVGDAAMAVDPLSGNGIFQSLSSALQAPAVINTLLRHPERSAQARAFHQARVEHLFYRFARIGRDFYDMEQDCAGEPFWQARRAWPDTEAMHQSVTPTQVQIARRVVLNGDLIDEAEVVVTPDQPLGMWHLNGVALAPLLRACRDAPDQPEDALARALGQHRAQAGALLLWMKNAGWV